MKILKTLYEQFADRIIYSLLENRLIETEDEEVYRFGIEITILKSIHFISYLLIAFFMKKVFEFLVVFTVFYLFRRNTGGFHCKTRFGCYLFSCIAIVLALFATEISFCWQGMAAISILDLGVLLVLSPVCHVHRKLDARDIACFRHRIKALSLIFLFINMATIVRGKTYFVWLYTVGVSMVTLLTVLGKLQTVKGFKSRRGIYRKMDDI